MYCNHVESGIDDGKEEVREGGVEREPGCECERGEDEVRAREGHERECGAVLWLHGDGVCVFCAMFQFSNQEVRPVM